MVGLEMDKIKKDRMKQKLLPLPSMGLQENLYSPFIETPKGWYTKVIVKATTNNRDDRVRPDSSDKSDGSALNLNSSGNSAFAKKIGEYGLKWGEQVKGDKYALPSFNEMMEGVLKWLVSQTLPKMENKSVQQQMRVINAASINFKKLKDAVDIQKSDVPLERSKDKEIGLYNPYSKVTCFVLYLYSMEFGSPTLYAELNRVTRDMDLSQLKNLGPI